MNNLPEVVYIAALMQSFRVSSRFSRPNSYIDLVLVLSGARLGL